MRLNMFLALLVVASGVTMNFPNGVPISNYNTLVPDVTYTINMTFSSIVIPSGSTVLLQLPTHFITNANTVGACMYHITGLSYTNVTCTAGYNVNNLFNEIAFIGVYDSTMNNQVNLNIKVNLSLFSYK